MTTRTSLGRTVGSVTTTNTSTNITAAADSFDQADVGRTITGTGIPAAATLTAVAADGASATLSAAATASGTITVTLGIGDPTLRGFFGTSPETIAEAETYRMNSGLTPPDRLVDTRTRAGQRAV